MENDREHGPLAEMEKVHVHTEKQRKVRGPAANSMGSLVKWAGGAPPLRATKTGTSRSTDSEGHPAEQTWLHASNPRVRAMIRLEARLRAGSVVCARQACGRILRHEEAWFGIQDEGCAVREQFFFFAYLTRLP
jgi:hypothetical protein